MSKSGPTKANNTKISTPNDIVMTGCIHYQRDYKGSITYTRRY